MRSCEHSWGFWYQRWLPGTINCVISCSSNRLKLQDVYSTSRSEPSSQQVLMFFWMLIRCLSHWLWSWQPESSQCLDMKPICEKWEMENGEWSTVLWSTKTCPVTASEESEMWQVVVVQGHSYTLRQVNLSPTPLPHDTSLGQLWKSLFSSYLVE